MVHSVQETPDFEVVKSSTGPQVQETQLQPVKENPTYFLRCDLTPMFVLTNNRHIQFLLVVQGF